MEYQAFLVKYAEIGLKGKNRGMFEDALLRQIRRSLRAVSGRFEVTKASGRIYVHANTAYDYDETVEALTRVFGVSAICPMIQFDTQDPEEVYRRAVAYMAEAYPDRKKTFKVETRRINKNFPVGSQDMNAELGEVLLNAYPELSVDVHHPDILLQVELREKVNIYSHTIPGPGGMPVGTNGRAMLLLSGGIDSPVAGYMIAKRGVVIDAVYFHAPPYTSERAKQKVVDLAKQVSLYAGPIRLHVVNFTDVQLCIYETCPHDELTIIMRRYMMKIAEQLAEQDESLALITGESIGQVASQTIQSLAVTNEVCHLPVFRPLIGFDKKDIVEIAQKIGTFETSILPYEDCCTIFVAKHPVTRPILKAIVKSEELLKGKIEPLVEEALATVETIEVGM
ncbi:MAG: tRNA 4-thiouridine(8) synthase ThiI [Lachnospiraceae bacterium]|nr:tRNA 4-thiouridine(8) synthase ThiI [Lachnospiraceae bacterium]